MALRVVVAYRPVMADGALLVYAQQRRYFDDHDDDRCPRLAFFEDLAKEVEGWKSAGNQVVLMADINQDVETTWSQWFEVMGLVNSIVHQHPVAASAPTVHQGSCLIDGIWMTPRLCPVLAGYLGFDREILSNHQVLWVKFTKLSVFGYKIPEIV